MKLIFPIIFLVLVACTSTSKAPQYYYSTPIPDTYDNYHKPKKVKSQDKSIKPEPISLDKTEQQLETKKEWTIYEDRFISTHDHDTSTWELGRSVPDIENRIKELNKK